MHIQNIDIYNSNIDNVKSKGNHYDNAHVKPA